MTFQNGIPDCKGCPHLIDEGVGGQIEEVAHLPNGSLKGLLLEAVGHIEDVHVTPDSFAFKPTENLVRTSTSKGTKPSEDHAHGFSVLHVFDCDPFVKNL